MKIAAISDIHSNVFALEAVIADIRRRGADVMVNLGDILYGPIAPRATFDLLMETPFVTVRGNQDRQIYEAAPSEISAGPTMPFIVEDLGPEPLEWLRTLPFDRQLNEDVYLCHGTPGDDLVYLLESVDSATVRLRPDGEILALLEGQGANLILCGHTHKPRSVAVSSGQFIVNPGSVGLPAYTDDEPLLHSMENFSHHAAYAMVEGRKTHWSVEQIKVDYPFEKAVKAAESRGRHDWARFLATGRGLS